MRKKLRTFAAINTMIIMARPIKETPTLYGEDARRFAYAVEHPKPVSAEKVRRAREVYLAVKAKYPNVL